MSSRVCVRVSRFPCCLPPRFQPRRLPARNPSRLCRMNACPCTRRFRHPDLWRCLDLGGIRPRAATNAAICPGYAVLALARSPRLPLLGHVAVVSRIVEKRVLMITRATGRASGANVPCRAGRTLFDVSSGGDWSWSRSGIAIGAGRGRLDPPGERLTSMAHPIATRPPASCARPALDRSSPPGSRTMSVR